MSPSEKAQAPDAPPLHTCCSTRVSAARQPKRSSECTCTLSPLGKRRWMLDSSIALSRSAHPGLKLASPVRGLRTARRGAGPGAGGGSVLAGRPGQAAGSCSSRTSAAPDTVAAQGSAAAPSPAACGKPHSPAGCALCCAACCSPDVVLLRGDTLVRVDGGVVDVKRHVRQRAHCRGGRGGARRAGSVIASAVGSQRLCVDSTRQLRATIEGGWGGGEASWQHMHSRAAHQPRQPQRAPPAHPCRRAAWCGPCT